MERGRGWREGEDGERMERGKGRREGEDGERTPQEKEKWLKWQRGPKHQNNPERKTKDYALAHTGELRHYKLRTRTHAHAHTHTHTHTHLFPASSSLHRFLSRKITIMLKVINAARVEHWRKESNEEKEEE